jgi:hypothetical protein
VNILQEALPGQVNRIAPQGRLDAVTVPALDAVIDEQLAARHFRLIIDLTTWPTFPAVNCELLRARRQAQTNTAMWCCAP